MDLPVRLTRAELCWLLLTANLIQPGVIREESINGVISYLDQVGLVGVSVEDYPDC